MKRLMLALLSVPVLAVVFSAPAEARDDPRGHRGPDRHHVDRRDHGRHHAPPPVVRHDYRPLPPPTPPRWVMGRPYNAYYRGPVYVVDDYHRYNLRRPPAGYRWMRSDHGDMILVAIATGIIADILLHH